MLFDRQGNRKYLTVQERTAFLAAADCASEPLTRSFCWTLACTGGRISEIRSLTPHSIEPSEDQVIIECLKRRERGIYRAVPVPHSLIEVLDQVHGISALKLDPLREHVRLWPWCRTTAWNRVKEVCAAAHVPLAVSKPKSFRHSFGTIGVALRGVPLPTMQRWLGHASMESTAEYTNAVGAEERALADRMWHFN